MSDLLPADSDLPADADSASAGDQPATATSVATGSADKTAPGAGALVVTTAADTAVSAGALVVRLIEAALRQAGRLPIRARTSPAGALGLRLDVVVFELRSLELAGIPIERLLLRAESLRVAPGLPPRLHAKNVSAKVRVTQEGLDRWRRRLRLPLGLHLTAEGIAVRGAVAGRSLGEITARVVADGPILRLRDMNASVLGVRAPGLGYLPVLLPLPPMPAGARLNRIDHEEGALTAWLDLGELDEAITPSLARRLVRRFVKPRFSWSNDRTAPRPNGPA